MTSPVRASSARVMLSYVSPPELGSVNFTLPRNATTHTSWSGSLISGLTGGQHCPVPFDEVNRYCSKVVSSANTLVGSPIRPAILAWAKPSAFASAAVSRSSCP